MAIKSSQGAAFSFNGTTFFATAVSVEGPTPEIVNMTAPTDPPGYMVMVPTGAYTAPGRISVDCMGMQDPTVLLGAVGPAVFSTSIATITRNVVCDSVNADGRVGDVLRLRLTFMPTDYTP